MDEDDIRITGKKMLDLHHSGDCQTVRFYKYPRIVIYFDNFFPIKIRSKGGKIEYYVPLVEIPTDVVRMIVKATAINFKTNETTGMEQPIT